MRWTRICGAAYGAGEIVICRGVEGGESRDAELGRMCWWVLLSRWSGLEGGSGAEGNGFGSLGRGEGG